MFPLGRLLSIQKTGKPAVLFTYHEPSGLLASVTGPGNNAASAITTTFNYTTDGSYTQAAALGQPLVVTDNLGHSSRFRYDSLGRLTNAWDSLGNESRYTYNLIGQTLTASVPATGQSGAGRGYVENVYLYMGGPVTATRVYNEAGSLVRTTGYTYGPEGEPLGVSGATEPFSRTYDAAYRVLSLTDGNGNPTTYSYDVAGRLASVTLPGGDLVQFPEYFADGQLKKRIDGNGTVTNYEYNDPEGLLTAVLYPATPGRNVSLSYDLVYGRLTGRTDGTGTQTYSYGDLDELTSVTTELPPEI